MTREELKEYNERARAKHLEINSKMNELQAQYIAENCTYKIGQIIEETKDINKKQVVVRTLEVKRITVQYDSKGEPQIVVDLFDTIGSKMWVKSLYL
jgi:hypothetical protein